MKDVIALIIITIISTIIVFEIVRVLFKFSHRDVWELLKCLSLKDILNGIENLTGGLYAFVQVFFWLILSGIAVVAFIGILEG